MERKVIRLNKGYKFSLFESGAADAAVFAPDFDDSSWEAVRVPHDWAASGEFKEENDISYNKIVQDGIMHEITHSGRTGAWARACTACGWIFRKNPGARGYLWNLTA